MGILGNSTRSDFVNSIPLGPFKPRSTITSLGRDLRTNAIASGALLAWPQME